MMEVILRILGTLLVLVTTVVIVALGIPYVFGLIGTLGIGLAGVVALKSLTVLGFLVVVALGIIGALEISLA